MRNLSNDCKTWNSLANGERLLQSGSRLIDRLKGEFLKGRFSSCACAMQMHKTIKQPTAVHCWLNAGSASSTLAQHWAIIGQYTEALSRRELKRIRSVLNSRKVSLFPYRPKIISNCGNPAAELVWRGWAAVNRQNNKWQIPQPWIKPCIECSQTQASKDCPPPPPAAACDDAASWVVHAPPRRAYGGCPRKHQTFVGLYNIYTTSTQRLRRCPSMYKCYWDAAYHKSHTISQQTQDIYPMLVQWPPSVVDDGPAFYQHWVNVSCLLRSGISIWIFQRTAIVCLSVGQAYRLIP